MQRTILGVRAFIAVLCQIRAAPPMGLDCRRSVGGCRDRSTNGSTAVLPVCAVMSQSLLSSKISERLVGLSAT
jgi:hypothetical protein